MSVSSDLRLISDMAYRLSESATAGLFGLPRSSLYARLSRLRKMVEELERQAIREINDVGFEVSGYGVDGESPYDLSDIDGFRVVKGKVRSWDFDFDSRTFKERKL